MSVSLIASKKIRNHVIRSVVFALVCIGVVIYLFCAAGPLYRYLNIDLSFLILPLIVYYALRLFSRLIGTFIYPRMGIVLALLINGTAFSFLSFNILSKAVLFSRIPLLNSDQKVLSDISHLAVWSILFIIGFTINQLANLLNMTRREKVISSALFTAGYLMFGVSLWRGFASFTLNKDLLTEIGLMLFVAMAITAVSRLGALGEESKYSVLRDICVWLKSSPLSKFFLGGIAAAYFVLIRPVIWSHSPYAFLIEWGLICLVGWRILSGIKSSLQKRHAAPYFEAPWSMHVQRVNDIADDDFNKFIVLQEDFIESGSRRELLNFLRQILINNGLNEKESIALLGEMIEYSDRKIPWYCFGYWKKRIQQQNRENRRFVLDNTVRDLNPLSLSINQQ